MAGKSKRNTAANLPSQRQLRVGESLRHALSEILVRDSFFDPDLEGVSITMFACHQLSPFHTPNSRMFSCSFFHITSQSDKPTDKQICI